MQIYIEKIIYPGRSFSRDNGKVILTDGGLPGELVTIKPVKEKKNYLEAEILNILEPSKHRAKPRCPHYKICSPYQCMDYPLQLAIKQGQITEIFSHHLNINLPSLKIKPSPLIWGYRNKIHLHILWENNAPYPAYHTPKSFNRYTRITPCHLLPPEVNILLQSFLDTSAEHNLESVKEVVIRKSIAENNLLLILLINSPTSSKISQALLPLADNSPLAGCICISRKEKKVKDTTLMGVNYLKEKIEDITFEIGPRCFFQINVPMAKQITEDLKQSLKLSGAETIADLYSGIGTFGLTLAKQVRHVFTVEKERENLFFLRRNIENNRIGNITVCPGASEKWISRILKKKIDILLVDPPRRGIGDFICGQITKNPPEKLVYISCNPATLIRDMKLLLESYTLSDITAYDFFPHTPHIETCSILTRK